MVPTASRPRPATGVVAVGFLFSCSRARPSPIIAFSRSGRERPGRGSVAAANRRHQQDFLRVVASRAKPVADIEEGHTSSSCILANLAMQLGRTLTWDPAKHQVVGDAEANRLLRRPYRQPWAHPEPDQL